MDRPVFRFAPSPNGELHLGHALSALINFDMAAAAGGRFLLRIEDIDRQRCRPEYAAALLADLRWLGLHWEEPVRRQSDHFPAYRRTVEALRRRGLVYPSFASRREIAAAVAAREAATGTPWPRDPDGAPLYPFAREKPEPAEAGRRIAAGEPRCWRLDMAAALREVETPLRWREIGSGGDTGDVTAEPERWGDVVLARKDVPTSYHLAVVVDDAVQGISHVVRGRDLFRATDIHRLLQDLLGLPAPLYRHHRLIVDAAGAKLSKSARDTSLRQLREAGASPGDIRDMVGL